MDSHEAREVLTLYRPGAPESDPRLTEALEQVQKDPELAAWFEQYSATQNAIRAKLKSIPIPASLKRRILKKQASEGKVTSFPMAARIVLAAAAVIVLCAVLWTTRERPPDIKVFTLYRDYMARSVQRGYDYMQTNLTNQADLLQFYHDKGGPTNFSLSATLQQLPAKGGAVVSWGGENADMICLDGGTPGGKNDLWVFVIDKKSLKNPPSSKPEFLPVYKLMTASWSEGDKIYLVVGGETQEDLAKYLE